VKVVLKSIRSLFWLMRKIDLFNWQKNRLNTTDRKPSGTAYEKARRT
jgi:hypothetical protein